MSLTLLEGIATLPDVEVRITRPGRFNGSGSVPMAHIEFDVYYQDIENTVKFDVFWKNDKFYVSPTEYYLSKPQK